MNIVRHNPRKAWIDPSKLPARATVEAKLADARMLVEIAVIAAQ